MKFKLGLLLGSLVVFSSVNALTSQPARSMDMAIKKVGMSAVSRQTVNEVVGSIKSYINGEYKTIRTFGSDVFSKNKALNTLAQIGREAGLLAGKLELFSRNKKELDNKSRTEGFVGGFKKLESISKSLTPILRKIRKSRMTSQKKGDVVEILQRLTDTLIEKIRPTVSGITKLHQGQQKLGAAREQKARNDAQRRRLEIQKKMERATKFMDDAKRVYQILYGTPARRSVTPETLLKVGKNASRQEIKDAVETATLTLLEKNASQADQKIVTRAGQIIARKLRSRGRN